MRPDFKKRGTDSEQSVVFGFVVVRTETRSMAAEAKSQFTEGYDWEYFVESEDDLLKLEGDLKCAICDLVKRSAMGLTLNTDDGKFADGWYRNHLIPSTI